MMMINRLKNSETFVLVKQALLKGACYYYGNDLLKIYLCGTLSRRKDGVVRDASPKLDEKTLLGKSQEMLGEFITPGTD